MLLLLKKMVKSGQRKDSKDGTYSRTNWYSTPTSTWNQNLAPRWRSAKRKDDAQHRDAIVRQYQAILHCMLALGFTDELDIDAELPDELMPHNYLALHGRA